MSNFPHSTTATSTLSTSPYALHSNLEALIQRSRTNPHAGQAPDEAERRRRRSSAATRADVPTGGLTSRRASRGDNLDPISAFRARRQSNMSTRSANTITTTAGANPGESGVLVFTHDEEIPEDAEATPQAVQSRLPSHGRKRGNSEAIATEDDTDDDGRGSRWRKTGRYGAIGVSEPLVAGGQQVTIENTRATAGNSRSRSKGRTPPRTIVRPMTRARRDAALAAGASLTALPPVMGSSLASASTEDDAADHSPVTPATPNAPFSFGAARRGRSAEERPMSPVVALRPLPSSSEDDQEYEDEEDIAIARNMARRASFLAGGSAFGGSAFTRLTFDPAEELDAQDLNLPTDEDGNEVHAWRKALAAEFPLIVRSTFPIFLAQLAEYSLALTSVISIGHLGTTELAASSMANMTASVTSYSIIQGLATALDTLLPAAWTSSDPTRVGLWTQRMFVVLFVSLFPMIMIWSNIERILLFLHQEPEIARLAAVYLSKVAFGLPGYATNVTLKKYLQAQGLMHIPTYIMFVVAPINVFLNWLLVWGPDSVRLGFEGGAVATAISFNLTGAMLLIYVLYIGPRDAFHPLTTHGVFSKLGTVTSLGLAGTIMLSSEWWAWEVCALAASLLGPTALAAQSVLLSSCSALYQFPAALGVAASVRVGNLLGSGRAWEAKWASRTSFILAFVFATFNSTLCIVFRHNWGYMFNNDPEVVAVVATVMPWIGLFQIMDGLAGAANAVLRSLALHSTGALINLSAYYVLSLPLGLWLTFTPWIPVGLVGLWIGLTVGLTYACALGVYIVWHADWARGVERVRERLGLPPLDEDVKFADEPEPRPRSVAEQDPERQPLL